jgi:hypothetical protein
LIVPIRDQPDVSGKRKGSIKTIFCLKEGNHARTRSQETTLFDL